jgi:hypothetical protein
MRTLHVDSPGGHAQMVGCGLGWQVWRNEFGETARHGGAYPGHAAVLAHDHHHGAVLAVMVPFAAAINAINPLLDPMAPVARDAPPASLDAYAGVYASHAARVVIERNDAGLQATIGGFPPVAIQPVDRSTFEVAGSPFAFFDFDEHGAPRFLRFRMRVQRRQ